MALNLSKRHPVLAYDLHKPSADGSEASVNLQWATSLNEVADRSEVIFTMLPSNEAVEEVQGRSNQGGWKPHKIKKV
jgi:3-hydroxyisobutyrate dehydrogenase-like beta-hydroxyacid dehydrogenase